VVLGDLDGFLGEGVAEEVWSPGSGVGDIDAVRLMAGMV
jgi:hypothetical protein